MDITCFLPSVVYQLEEYGLPRIITKKLHGASIIDFLASDLNIHDAIALFKSIGKAEIASRGSFDDSDIYILDYFLDGIRIYIEQ